MKSTRIFMLLCALLLTSCSWSGTSTALPATQVPLPPVVLRHLPVTAKMTCGEHPVTDQALTYLWEYPGKVPATVDPSDPRSAKGRSKGLLADCSPILIEHIAWSEIDREYYVYVVAEKISGWVTLSLISLDGVNP